MIEVKKRITECSGLCLTGYDLGVPTGAVAYAHPECELHSEPEELHHANCPCHDCMYDRLSEGW